MYDALKVLCGISDLCSHYLKDRKMESENRHLSEVLGNASPSTSKEDKAPYTSQNKCNETASKTKDSASCAVVDENVPISPKAGPDVPSVAEDKDDEAGSKIEDSKPKFKCDLCDKVYRHKSDMKRHKKVHTEIEFKCKHCDVVLPSQASLVKHQASKHSSDSADVGEHFLLQLIVPDVEIEVQENSAVLQSQNNRPENNKKYVCEVCDVRVRDKRALERHMKQHAEPQENVEKVKGYPCEECEERFRDKRSLERHMRQHSKPHVCEQCQARFVSEEELKDHESKHEMMKEYTCEICHQVYSSSRNLKRHHLIHANSKQLSCPVCKKEFSLEKYLRSHMKRHEETTCNDCTAVFDTEDELLNHVCILQCRFCMQMFASRSILEEHMTHLHTSEVDAEAELDMESEAEETDDVDVELESNEPDNDNVYSHSNDEQDELPDGMSCTETENGGLENGVDNYNGLDEVVDTLVEELEDEMGNEISDEEKPLQDTNLDCIACGESFSTTKDLKQHMTIHSSKRSFNCMKCSKNFTTMTNLRRHLQHHEKNTCKKCGLFFIHAKSLEIHDCGFTPYCDMCHRPFNSKREYRLHMSTHGVNEEDVKNECYNCPDCGKSFAKLMNYRAHIASHKGEKPFVCQDCREGFLSATALRIHRRSHTGKTYFSCQQCSATFVYEFKLRQHLLTHKTDAEMPFHCPHCKQGFVAKSGLLRHEVVCQTQTEANSEEVTEAMRRQRLYNRSKVGKNPNKKCSECGESFLRYDQFLLHMRTHNEKAELPLKCTYCPKGFVHEYNRRQHERFCMKRSAEERVERLEKEKDYNLYKTFKGQKVFKCPECNQMFRYRHKFLLHQETHKSDGEKKYQCPLCLGGFVSRSGLKRHGMHCEKRSQVERGKRQEKKIKKVQKANLEVQSETCDTKGDENCLWCADCGEGFTEKLDLASHRLSCVKAANSDKKGVVVKNSSKEYKCPVCTRVFHFAHILKLHIDAHNGVYPYNCKMCSRGFTLKSSFMLHKCLKDAAPEGHEDRKAALANLKQDHSSLPIAISDIKEEEL